MQLRQIKDKEGVRLWEHDKIEERWKCHYDKLLNEANWKTHFGDGAPNDGNTQRGSRYGAAKNEARDVDGIGRNSRINWRWGSA